MAAGRKIEDERDARRCSTAMTRSGQTMREWARAHEIDGRSLHAQANNLARRGAAGRSGRKPGMQAMAGARGLIQLLPLTPIPVASNSTRYVLDAAGARVEFGDDVSVATLRREVEALRPC